MGAGVGEGKKKRRVRRNNTTGRAVSPEVLENGRRW